MSREATSGGRTSSWLRAAARARAASDATYAPVRDALPEHEWVSPFSCGWYRRPTVWHAVATGGAQRRVARSSADFERRRR
ncbi:protein of unknown function [Streptantibioticus cattleyicolor NRRL 8057 = DSM 46488]|nr:protein of unknown function [Streptantibioticus cattleyicolor NRRL 8057 = DSM 46488]